MSKKLIQQIISTALCIAALIILNAGGNRGSSVLMAIGLILLIGAAIPEILTELSRKSAKK